MAAVVRKSVLALTVGGVGGKVLMNQLVEIAEGICFERTGEFGLSSYVYHLESELEKAADQRSRDGASHAFGLYCVSVIGRCAGDGP